MNTVYRAVYYAAYMNETTEKGPCLAMTPYGVIGLERVIPTPPPPPPPLVLEPDPRKIEKEGLAHRLGWKCTLRNVRNLVIAELCKTCRVFC